MFLWGTQDYKCYSPSLNKYLKSDNVNFFETSFFFSSRESILVIDWVQFSSSPSIPQQDKPFITYQQHHHPIKPQITEDAFVNSQSSPETSPILDSPNNLPIALCKGTWTTCNPYPTYNFLSYHCLSPSNYAFVFALSLVFIPKTIQEFHSHSRCCQTMLDEMIALDNKNKWDLVLLPLGKTIVDYR